MSQDNIVTLYCKETGEYYITRKNKKKLADVKLTLKKYSKKLRKIATFVETKKIFKKK